MEMGTGSGEINQIHAPLEHDFMVKGKQVALEEQNHEWDLNEWKWDGNLFVAERLNTSQSFSNGIEILPSDASVENGKAFEKRRKISVLREDQIEQGDASLTLRLGEEIYTNVAREHENTEGKNGKKFKSQPSQLNPLICQVDACSVNLNDVRDYHRRHKVCETHAKSTRVLLGGVLQRFCQQCSRFHLLQEFDEEKRSCRRRLAGHNRRRRKNPLDTIVSGHSLKDDQASRYILICLLNILTNLHSNKSDKSKDQDILFQLLGMLSSPIGWPAPEIVSGLAPLQPETLLAPALLLGSPSGASAPKTTAGISPIVAASSSITIRDSVTTAGGYMPMKVAGAGQEQVSLPRCLPLNETIVPVSFQNSTALVPVRDGPLRRHTDKCFLMPPTDAKIGEQNKQKLNDFDLNRSYNEFQDYNQGSERSSWNDWKNQIDCSDFHLWPNKDIPQTSPGHTSGSSESLSDGEDVQGCTDRIIFKLFGKDPGDLPHVLRAQILNWLSHSPTDIEGYIKPGCIVLTIYLRLSRHAWKELCGNLTSGLKRLLETSDDTFWRTGWMCAKVGRQIAFIHNGQVLLDTPLSRSQNAPLILSVKPVAANLSEQAIFAVKGRNLTNKTTKLLCAFRGKQIAHEIEINPEKENYSSSDGVECLDGLNEEIQTLTFTCSLSKTCGRGFIEVEDHGLGYGFFPFIIAEHEICLELRTLESSIDFRSTSNETSSKDEVIEFLMEFGWLLERSHLLSRSEHATIQSKEFSSVRFKWLLEFSIEHDWCAVVKKILDILFDRKVGGHDCPVDQLLSRVSPLHRAVRRNCRPMVEFLLKYTYTSKEKRPYQVNQEPNVTKKVFKSNMKLPLLLLAVFGRRWRRKQRLPLPPGPMGLPILGNLHLLGPLPHQTFSKLAEDYGPIMYLRLGLHPAVVITSPQAAEKILKTHDSIFASRPLTDTGKYLFYGQKAIAFTEYGPYWRNIRRISTAELLTTAKIESFGHLRREELGVAVHTLEEMAKTGGVVDLTTLVGSSIANVSCRMLFGRKYTDDELDKTRRFKEVIDESMRLAGAFNIAEFIPFLAPLDLQGIRRDMKAVSKVFDDFFEKVIDEHIQNRGKEEKNKDFVDIMLALMESRGNGVQLDKTNLKAIILDMVIASMDTSAATVEWTMSELIKQPRVMKKLQEELLRVVGEDRMVDESDLPKLEYLDMVVKEAMRLHPVAPLLIPHVATQDCTIDGYFIPKGTRAFVNVWAIGRNPTAWPEPEEFRPERFIGSSINASGHYYELLPFGSGRRLCPGLPLGNIAVRLFVAQFVHCFDWKLPNGMLPSELDMNEKAGLIVQRAHHLMAIPVTRLRHDTLKCI